MAAHEAAIRFSVIIPTFMRRDIVTKAAHAISHQDFNGSFEIIVVVDGSDDGSTQALRELQLSVPCTVLEQPNRGAAAARNRGFSIAKGEILLFLDDDMEAHPRLLEEHDISHRAGADVVMGHLPLHPNSPDNFLSKATKNWAEERQNKLSTPGIRPEPSEILTGQLSVSRKVFYSLGGFDTAFTHGGTFGNEDIEFGHRLRLQGSKVVFNPKAISWQYYDVEPREYIRKMAQAGQADTLFARKHPDQARKIFSLDGAQRPLVRYCWRPVQRLPLLASLLSSITRRVGLSLIDRGIENAFTIRLFREAVTAAYWKGVYNAGGVPLYRAVRVLAYHAMSELPAESGLEAYGVPPSQFRRQLRQLLSAGYHFLEIDEFLRFLDGRAGVPRRALLLTFDDAYADLPRISPILRDYKITGVIFVVSGRIGGTNEWDHALGAPRLSLMDAKTLRKMAQNGFEIGLHSRTHPLMTRITDSKLAEETEGAAQELERIGLARPRLFAYPYGDHNKRVQKAVKKAGLAAAFTVESGIIRSGESRYALRRLEIFRDDSGWRLSAKVLTGGLPSKAAKAAQWIIHKPKRIAKTLRSRLKDLRKNQSKNA